MMHMIDLDLLDKVQEVSEKLRADNFPQLSTVYVPGEGGNPVAFIVGEAPGANENMRHRPFVGKAGIVLRDLMADAGLCTERRLIWRSKTDVDGKVTNPNCWLTNAVKFRPPGNRKPTPREVKAFRWVLREEWQAVGRPRVIVPIGNTAIEAVMGKSISILKMLGKWHTVRSRDGLLMFVCPMVNPSFGLRNPALQPLLERDWQNLGKWLCEFRHETGYMG